MHVTKCMHEAFNQNVGRLFVTEILFSTDQYEPHAESTLIRLHELMSWPTVSTINIPTVDCTHIYKKKLLYSTNSQYFTNPSRQIRNYNNYFDYSDYAPFTALCPQPPNQNCWIRDNDKTKTIYSHYFLRCKLMYSTAYYFCSQSSCAKFTTRPGELSDGRAVNRR